MGGDPPAPRTMLSRNPHPFSRGPVRRPAYYYCNCKEGYWYTAHFPDFKGVTGLVEGSSASNLNSARPHSRISAKG